jgi:hypothetical protein
MYSKDDTQLLLKWNNREIMNYELYSDIILRQDIPEEGLSAGDVGTLVEKHQIEGLETGYSVEFFDMLGKSIALPKKLNAIPI